MDMVEVKAPGHADGFVMMKMILIYLHQPFELVEMSIPRRSNGILFLVRAENSRHGNEKRPK
jgi:hypothetical protein